MLADKRQLNTLVGIHGLGRDSPVGVVALTQMAVGDGVAEIAGR